MGPKIKPIIQAILIADHIYQDGITGKFVVAGIFGKIYKVQHKTPEVRGGENPSEGVTSGKAQVPQADFNSGSPFAYVSLTEVHGEQKVELRYVRLNDEQVYFTATMTLNSLDPLAHIETCCPLPMLSDEVGNYALELIWNEELLGAHRIEVVHMTVENTDDSSA